MTDIVERLELENGKYALINTNGHLKALRYGEPWRDLLGDNLIGALWSELESLRQQLAESQAREKKRVELMDKQYWMDAQSIPQDSTALDEALAKAKREGGREALLTAANVLSALWGQSVDDIVGDLRRMAEGIK